MDFYSHQAAARQRTRWLLLGFIAAVAVVVLALDAVLLTIIASVDSGDPGLAPLSYAASHPDVAVACALFVLAVILVASLYKSLQLRDGGGAVARSLGGFRIDRDTADLSRKRLHNVVEEMAIASGVPMPEVYVLEQEEAINAFAAGHTPANAAVAVTQGALERLNRDELQGVIAHEFSHILNGDMRLNVRLVGWLFGLLAITFIGRMILRFGARGRKGAAGLLLVGLAATALGYIGLTAGRILQAAVSRHRERLADASAVQFTRNPAGLKEALLKIATLPQGSRLIAPDAEEVAHMLFAPGLSRLFATHPPMFERIRALDPHFDRAELDRVASGAWRAARALLQPEAAHTAASGRIAPLAEATPVASGKDIAAKVGQFNSIDIRQALQLRLSLPEDLREFVESSGRAQSLMLALLLSRDERVGNAQLRFLSMTLESAELAAVQEAAPLVRELPPMLRLPALQQLFPALRHLPLDKRRRLEALVDRMIRNDARIDMFEFCLARLLSTLLRDQIEARTPHGQISLAKAQGAIHTLFAVLAQAGAADETAARRAYEAGMQLVLPMHRPAYQSYEDWPERLSEAFAVLERLHPYAKKPLIEALVRTIAHDETLNVEEAELLRTTCALLHCPLPPLLPAV